MTDDNKTINIDLAGAMDRITPELVEAMAPILTDPLVLKLQEQLTRYERLFDLVEQDAMNRALEQLEELEREHGS